MAYVEQDSELFTNVISATAIPAGRAFTAFKDVDGSPAIFSLGSNDTGLPDTLNLFVQTAGKLVNFDFGRACGVTDRVTAFGVRQRSDSSLFIVFSVEKNGRNEILVLPNLQVKDIASPVHGTIITSDMKLPEIHGIYLSDYSNSEFMGRSYPDIILAFQPLDRITSDADCGLLSYTSAPSGSPIVSISTKWSLPVNATAILDLAFGELSSGRKGVFVLYTIQGKTKILYTAYNADYEITIDCPTDATCLASYVNGTGSKFAGRSSLLVGSSQIRHFTPSDISSKGEGTRIVGDLLKPGLKDLHVAQHGSAVTMWFTNKEDAAGYYHATSDTGIGTGSMVNLLTPGKGGRLSGMITATSAEDRIDLVNTVISVDENSNLTSLQQSSANGAWDEFPVMMSTKLENYEVQSYTTRIKIMSDANTAAANSTFVLTATGRVPAVLNGSQAILEAGGTTVKTDGSGEATLIVATSDISTHTFEITVITDSDGRRLEIPSVQVNPGEKAQIKLQSLQDGDSLRNAKTQKDEDLIDQNAVSDGDIDHAGTVMKDLSTQATFLAQASRNTKLRQKLNSASLKGSTQWEFWTWVRDKVHEAEDWAVKKIDGIAHFVVTLAGEVKAFILDTVDAVGKAFSWVFAKLKVAFQKLIDFLGFLFNWDDILDTKDSLSAFMIAGLDWCSGKIDETIPKIDKYFGDIKNKIDNTTSSVGTEDINKTTPESQERQKSVGFNWSKYHFIHGGAGENFNTDVGPDNKQPIDDLWSNTIKPAADKFLEDIKKLGSEATDLFKDTKTQLSIQQVMALIGKGLALSFIDVAQSIVDSILKLLKDLLKLLRDIGTKVVNVPVFSALYRKLTHGHELTAFDVICLIIAVPATITCKALTTKTVPNLKDIMAEPNGAKMIQQYVDGTATAQQMQDINTTAAMGSIGGIFIGAAISTVILAIDDIDPTTAEDFSKLPTMLGNPVIRTRRYSAVLASGIRAVAWSGVMKAFDLANLITGASNTFWALPAKLSAGPVRFAAWYMWGMMSFRWVISLVAFGVGFAGEQPVNPPPERDWKDEIAVFQTLTGTVQLIIQIAVAVEAGGGAADEARKIVIAACYWLGTLSKTTAVAWRKNTVVSAGATGLYAVLGTISAGLQIWNFDECLKLGEPWPPTATVN